MNIGQLVFDENMEMYVDIELGRVRLVLSDGLYAYEEELTDVYKEKIVAFLDRPSISTWYKKAVQAIMDRGKQVYGIETMEKDLKLQSIFILFEQNEAPLFGLGFRTEFDIEHGCGLKISGEDFEVREVGTADVAFC
jgi:hypothetical protein